MHDFLTMPQPPVMTGIQDSQLLEAWVRDQRQVDVDLAEDIAQQVFAILARKVAWLGGVGSLSAWLDRVTLLQCRFATRCRVGEAGARVHGI